MGKRGGQGGGQGGCRATGFATGRRLGRHQQRLAGLGREWRRLWCRGQGPAGQAEVEADELTDDSEWAGLKL